MLEMTEAGQNIFLQRVLFIFDVTKRSAGKAQVLRLSLQQWQTECDVCCVAAYVLEEMRRFRDPENTMVFPAETLAIVINRLIEGWLALHPETRILIHVHVEIA